MCSSCYSLWKKIVHIYMLSKGRSNILKLFLVNIFDHSEQLTKNQLVSYRLKCFSLFHYLAGQ